MNKSEVSLILMNDFSPETKQKICHGCQWCTQAQTFFNSHANDISGQPTMTCDIVNGEHVLINASAKLRNPIPYRHSVQEELHSFMRIKLTCPALATGSEPDHDHL